MATLRVIEVAGREVTISNPDKVFFPETGYTKLDMVHYYLAVADGALRGAGGRPMALKRFVNGAEGELFFQKRAPESRPDWIETVELSFPSGRTADEIVLRDAAQLPGSSTWAASTSTRTRCAPRTSTIPTSCASTSIRCPACRGTTSAGSRSSTAKSLADHGLVGWPKTSGSRGIHINVRIEPRWTFPRGPSRGAGAGARGGAARARHRHQQVVEGGAPRRLPRLQPERQGPDGRLRLLGAADARCARLDAAALGRGRRRRDGGLHAGHRARDLRGATAMPARGIDEAVGSLEALLELSARDEAEGHG